ncbi:hypothetical protein [Gaopeijia maritima]|uniref:hypothetical protein n=1 Tax=Gaopeijia maritima TaxID=3119007 RepID=UPI0032831862
MSVSYHTEERLKGYLDSNQLHRERLSLAVLAIDRRFSDVRPRQPRGGPDGGRDIEAVFRADQKTFGAVGFVNQANDSAPQKTQVRKKFEHDLGRALEAEQAIDAFVFFTNVDLTSGEEESLVASARATGVHYCEIFDRERIRIALDSPDGLAIRFQYLGLPLSEAEQASFFARWGDDIQGLVATGFRRVEKVLDRLLFLEESRDPMTYLRVDAELDGEYTGEALGHVRLFCSLQLKEIRRGMVGLLFGVFDRPFLVGERDRLSEGAKPGIGNGEGRAQWQHLIDDTEDGDEVDHYHLTGSSEAVGRRSLNALTVVYSEGSWIRFEPGIPLRDLDAASWILFCNKSLATRIAGLRVSAGGYELYRCGPDGFVIDETAFPSDMPVPFSPAELADPWVRIRPSSGVSMFDLPFYTATPRRLSAPTHFTEHEPPPANHR